MDVRELLEAMDRLSDQELLAELTDAHNEQRAANARYLDALARRRAATAVLSRRSGWSLRKIAAHLGITPGAVYFYMKAGTKGRTEGREE